MNSPPRTSCRAFAYCGSRAWLLVPLVTLLLLTLKAIAQENADGRPVTAADPSGQRAATEADPKNDKPEADAWRSLFDGQALGHWRPSAFGGQGDVTVEDGMIVLDFGSPLTGVTYSETFPTSDYQLRLEARRESGNDFFCGLTFPVGDGHCTLILGGWGGALVGLSSIDGLDASQNATRQYLPFRSGQWYAVRIEVNSKRIQVWLDDEQIIHQPRADHLFTLRPEVDRSKPLGIASFDTRAEIRRIQWRPSR